MLFISTYLSKVLFGIATLVMRVCDTRGIKTADGRPDYPLIDKQGQEKRVMDGGSLESRNLVLMPDEISEWNFSA